MMWFFASRLLLCSVTNDIENHQDQKRHFALLDLCHSIAVGLRREEKTNSTKIADFHQRRKYPCLSRVFENSALFSHLQKTTCLLPYSNVLSRSFPNRICMRNLVQYIVSSSPSLGSKKHLGRFLLRPYYSTELTCPIFFPVWRSLEEEETESQGESLLFHGSSRVQLMTWKQLKGHKQSFKVSDIDKERSLMRDIWLQHYLQ